MPLASGLSAGKPTDDAPNRLCTKADSTQREQAECPAPHSSLILHGKRPPTERVRSALAARLGFDPLMQTA